MSGSLVSAPKGFAPSAVSITRYLAQVEQQQRALGRSPVSLAGGKPNPAVYDRDEYNQLAFAHIERMAARGSVAGIQNRFQLKQYLSNYTGSECHQAIRDDFLAGYQNDFNVQMSAGRLLPTNGNTQAISLLLQMYNKLGIAVSVFTPSPTYAGVLSPLQYAKNVRPFAVNIDENGMVPHDLEEQIQTAKKTGFHSAFIYLVPDGDNPSGITLSQERRDALYEVAARNGVFILEDTPYGYLRLEEGEEYPALMAANDPENIVMHAFSASKIGVPDERVAWLHVPNEWKLANGQVFPLYNEVVAAFAAQSLIHSAMSLAGFNGQMYNDAGEFVGLWPQARKRSAFYRNNRDVLFDGLQTALAGHPDLFQLSPKPKSGFVFCLKMPGLQKRTGMDAVELARWLIEKYEVIVTPMAGFYPEGAPVGSGSDEIRFAYSAASPEELRQGVDRLVSGLQTAYSINLG